MLLRRVEKLEELILNSRVQKSVYKEIVFVIENLTTQELLAFCQLLEVEKVDFESIVNLSKEKALIEILKLTNVFIENQNEVLYVNNFDFTLELDKAILAKRNQLKL